MTVDAFLYMVGAGWFFGTILHLVGRFSLSILTGATLDRF